jgi:DNA polymerase-3 subunit delta'
MEARHRVVIVDDVETMQETAQEAFLKTLEEPPSYAVILLLTTDAELLLPTIRSRCTTIQLQTVLSPRIANALVAAGVGEHEAQTIATASVGRPGWAFEAANKAELLTDKVELASSVLSWIRSDQYQRMAEATRLGDTFGKDRNAVYARLSAAQTIWRASVLQSLGVGDLEIPGAVAVDHGTLTPQDALTALRSVEACLIDLDTNVRPRLALQSMVLEWPTLTT